MRKINLMVIAGISAGMMFAQTGRKAAFTSVTTINQPSSQTTIKRTCGTVAPPVEWEVEFQKLIEQYVKDHPELMNGKVYANYTIPVVFHVVHGGQAVGTYPNLAQGQINSQVQVLNADYAGTGLNVSNYPANAFVNYAASLPAANKDGNGRVKIANTGVQFCLATKDPNGNTLPEPGIDRINYVSKGWSDPASFTSSSSFQSFIDGTVKPQTIWDPNRYFNVWVTDESTSVGLLGYATFPAGTGLTGLSGFGTATTDGVWIYAKACGSKSIYPSGTYATPYDRGRTLTHEAGHWLGLRHIWGDSNCGNDYCNDTPPAQTSNYGTISTYPYHAGTCSGNSPDGEMYMNFMDYTDDASMYMFTVDQTTRIQTAMANGTYRKNLTTSASTLCASSSPAANACFTMPSTGCVSTPVNLTNCSTGSPTPTYTWSANPPTGVTFNPNQNASNPSVTFANTGTYTITLTASNGTVNTTSHVISISSCVTQTVCNDTITNIRNTDTLVAYITGAPTSTCPGYVSGNNCYGDKEKAEWFAASTYSHVSPAQYITSAIVLFYKNGNVGTHGNASSQVNLKIYTGNSTSGPSTAVATATANLGLITSGTPTTNVTYCGDPNIGYSTAIILPYKYNFTTPVGPLSSSTPGGFFASVVLPTTSGDTAVIFNNTDGSNPTNTMWEKWNTNAWYAYDNPNSWGIPLSGAILPILTCSTGKDDLNAFTNSIMIVPNPSNGIFNIVTTFSEKQNIKFEVINTLGQVLNQGEFQNVMNNYLTLNLSHYENGIYFIKLTNGSEKVVKRIIINK
ncbi:MAG TPA: M43 family zinc metalloprotease [Bacteroidia bacterium]|nr:M43 family zinc metalloprotease [Bacteroidia bacterium]